jgi:hypothetical protein
VSKLPGSKPTPECRSRSKLRISRVEPASSTTESATCETMSALRSKWRSRVPVPRPLSARSAPSISGFDSWSAGAIPKSNPQSREAPTAKSTASPSR